MIKQLTSLLFFLLAAFHLIAQVPSNIILEGEIGHPNTELNRGLCNEAGTFTFGTLSGQSNDIDPDTIFLCFNDILPIIHNGDVDLGGDPDLATAAGIGYALYDCPPTISGPDLATIISDVCVNHTSPILVGGTPIPQLNNIWVSTGTSNGNIDLVNDGSVQMAFNNGMILPTAFWLAPITIDNFAALSYESAAVGMPAGPCVDVSTDEAIYVVYLTEITASNISINGSPTGCLGSFTVEGGLPEFIASANYDISISLQSDPTITASFPGVPNHGDLIEFNVPQPGIYDVVIEDGKSCGTAFTMDMSACETVVFNLPFENVPPGTTNVCLDLTVENFTNVASVQYTMTWDPTILSFNQIANINPAFTSLSEAGNFFLVEPGVLTFSWNTFTTAVSLNDGDLFYELCFDIIGVLDDCSGISIVDEPVEIEVGDPGGPGTPPFQYGVIINDGKIIVSNEVLFVFLEQDSLTCPGDMDGAFTLTLGGGTAPYQYSWNTVPTSGPDNGPFNVSTSGVPALQSGLPAGFYQITVTDATNPIETRIDTVEVLAGPVLGVSLEPTGPLCNGDSTGTVRAVIFIDGVEDPNPGNNFTFTWNIAGETNDTLLNLPFGFYAVTVTDASGCMAEASTTLSQPPPLQVLQNSTFITNASCSGVMDGEITLAAQGGTSAAGTYTFQWEGMPAITASNSTVTGLEPGEYFVTITDDNSCEFATSFVVGAQKTLTITGIVSDISCNSVCDGTIFITGSTSGAPADEPYAFTWDNFSTAPANTATTSTIADLCVGTYNVTMEDASVAACQTTATFMIIEPAVLTANVVEQTNETCVVGNDGSATIEITGGTFPYTYAWSHDVTLTDSIATNLSEGAYTFDVTDANNCTTSLMVNILAPAPPTILQLDDDFISCAGNTDGELTVTAVPGNAAIASIQWTNGTDIFNGSTITGLSPGTYIVTVTDEGFCESIDTAVINSPSPMVLDSIVVMTPTCPGDGNGQVAVFASGGTAPYGYTWSTIGGPSIINPLPGLFAGNYTVTVTDANNCPDSLLLNAAVNDPPTIDVSISNALPVTCPDDMTCDGQATATAIYSDGSAGTFLFEWPTEQEIGVASSTTNTLCRGLQTLIVGDGTCSTTLEIDVASPEDISVDVDQDQPTCNGDSDGSILLTPAGGTAPFNYQWVSFPGEMTATLSPIPQGTYTAILTDANNCTHTQIVQLNEPVELMLILDPAQSTGAVSCSGDSDGIMAVTYNSSDAINPVGPNPYTWSNMVAPSSSSIATSLSTGTYSVTITDINGCTDEVSHTINEPNPIIFSVDDTQDPLCFGDQTLIQIDTAYGGSGMIFEDYQFIVDNNGLSFPVNQGAPVFAGDHTVTIIDPQGCTNELEITINQPNPLIITMEDRIVIELGDSLTQLSPNVSGGTQPYVFHQWTPGEFLSSDTVLRPTIIPLGDQEYTLTVIDANDCVQEASIFVELDANRNVFVPNIFSPNGDGPNDEFRIFACRGVKSINFAKVFNRWGALVYENDNIPLTCEGGSILWDGRFQGDLAPSAVYVYVIEVTFWDDVTLLYRGDIAIIR